MSKVRFLSIGAGLAVMLSAWSSPAQTTLQGGSAKITLPAGNWTNEPAPDMNAPLRPDGSRALVRAQNPQKNLQAHVTSFEYPANASDKQIAYFTERLFQSYRVRSFGSAVEKSLVWSGFPMVEKEYQYPGWKFVKARLIFCEARAYLVELGGAGESRKDADACWESFSLSGEKPLASAKFEAAQIERQKVKPAPPQETKSAFPYRQVIVVSVAAILFFAALGGCIWVTQKARTGELNRIILRLRFGRRRHHD
jgi:hypothetical protein